MENISIITVNYNGFAITCELIDSLYRVGFDGEIIVVDNGSKEDESKWIAEKYPKITAIRSNENLGFSGGNNLGIRVAKGDYLFFLNNDTTLTEQIWIPLIERLNSTSDIGMVCPKIMFEYAPDTIQFAGYTELHSITLRNAMIGFNQKDEGQYQIAHTTPYAMGAAMMTHKRVIEKAGEMPECYFLYYEELDWSERIKEVGFTIWYEPMAYIFHKESAATGRMSALKQYYLTRNRLFFVKRNLKGIAIPIAIVYQLLISLTKNCFQSLLQKRFDLCSATIKGFIDGMKMIMNYGDKCD
ncbi:MAG: glycosyltransferase family 2 protein [Bacteroidales bacterium]|nr:glycosyltransferase family 2 protein [Bacteroidales bacterium]